MEHVAQPIYIALQALPSLTKPVRNDALSLATAFYGGSIAYHIAHKYPEIVKALTGSASSGEDGENEATPMRDGLEGASALTDILINETPWVVEAQQQKANRERLASLFSEMEQEQRRMAMLSALSARQHSDGSFGWFPGMYGSEWITTEVAMLLVRLGEMTGGLAVPEIQMLDKAMGFLGKMKSDGVESLRNSKKPVLSFSQLRYLYIYIMYKSVITKSASKGEEKQYKKDAETLLSILKKQAEDLDREDRSLAAIVLKRAGEEKKAQALMPRIHELLRHADGMYLAYPGGSFVSIDRKVETHVNLMEAVQTVEPKETGLLGQMAEWLMAPVGRCCLCPDLHELPLEG